MTLAPDAPGALAASEAAEVSPQLWALALLTLTGSLAIHIFVPALADAAGDLRVSVPDIELTISLYIIGMAVGQLLYGPISDRYGRRGPLLAGLVLYIAAGMVTVIAPNLYALIAARVLQAFGGCAGLVLARAMVRDTTTTEAGARQLALLTAFQVIGPAIAPVLGSEMALTLGWRSVFAFLVVIGVVNLASALWVLPETRPVHRRRATGFAEANLTLLRIPAFRWLVIGGGACTTSVYGVISAAPFVFQHNLHRAPESVGPWLMLALFTLAVGTLIARRLLVWFPMQKVLAMSNWLTLVSGLSLLAVVLTVPLTLTLFILPVAAFSFATGLQSPIAATAAISVRPDLAGSASGLYGFTQMVIAAICTALSGLGQDPALAAALVLAGVGVLTVVAFRRAAAHGW